MNMNVPMKGQTTQYAAGWAAGISAGQVNRTGAASPQENTQPKPDTTVSPIQMGTYDKHYDTDPNARPNIAQGDTMTESQAGLERP